jgi:hypothetical protein
VKVEVGTGFAADAPPATISKAMTAPSAATCLFIESPFRSITWANPGVPGVADL